MRGLPLQAALLLPLAGLVPAQAPQEIPADGNRGLYVHRIPLLHAEGGRIGPDDDPLLPFSTRRTCGECHDYGKIRRGLHFHWPREYPSPRFPLETWKRDSLEWSGEPWILCDRRTGTRLPLSWRGEARPTWHPAEVGLDRWLFTRIFGAWTAGGGPGEPEKPDPAREGRFLVAGRLEINCLLCHGASPEQDGGEWGVQVGRQNLMWAAAAASGLASVTGTTAGVSNTYDPFMEFDQETRGPRVRYRAGLFDPDGNAFIDLRRRAGPERCLRCHSRRLAGVEKWRDDPDVHLAAGLTCQDCHRNGLDHAMTRGQDDRGSGPDAGSGDPFSCRACHLESGRLGAPRPRHAGFPSFHFEKLSCTACHAGPVPGARTRRVQTSRSHRMGVKGAYRGEGEPPEIETPVMIRGADGAIAPNRLMWPAFFGRLREGRVTPLDFFALRRRARALWGEEREGMKPTRAEVTALLAELAGEGKGEPVYLAGGRLHRRGGEGRLVAEEHPQAAPVAWRLAHPVRPAAASLGFQECQECHRPGAPFFWGRVTRTRPVELELPPGPPMHAFQEIDEEALAALALSFSWRELYKTVGFAAAAAALAVLALYFFLAVKRITRRSGRRHV